MHILEIWRYPVKSVGGERLDQTDIGATGIPFDRGWGIVDSATGNVLTARREPQLLQATATVVDGFPVIVTADNRTLSDSNAISDWLERPVTLTPAAGSAGGTYENPLHIGDDGNDDDWKSWQGPADAWHDSGTARLSFVSVDTLGSWDFRRFRSNVLLNDAGEDDLVGRAMRLGECELDITKRISRCVMVTRPQPGLDRDLEVLRAINRDRDQCLAVGAVVTMGGRITVGDELVDR